MLKKVNTYSELRLFLIFFILIFIIRSIFLQFSLSKYPWFYEWEAMKYLVDIKDKNLDIFEFLKLYEIKNQFQIFTKIIYLTLFKINNSIWYPKLFTILIQIIPAIYLSIIIKNLFKGNLNNNIIFYLLLFFSIIPASLANFYHFSESHFYIHIFISILSFEAYLKFKNKLFKLSFVLLFLFVAAALNMEFVALTLYLTFAFFFLYRFIETLNKKFIFIFILFIIFSLLYFQALYFFEIPVIKDGSQTIDKKLSRSFYLVFKVLFHQNSLILGIFLISILLNLKFFFNELNKNVNRDFIILVAIFFAIFTIAVSFSRIQIYDRYKDFIQLGGILTIYIFNILYFKNKLLRYFFLTISVLLVTYNSLFFLDKFYERKIETIKYDKNLDKNINAYLFKKEDIKENNLDKYSQRFINQIKFSIDNKILKIKYPN
tara:strand:+ start:2847 stop:4139 length:1293 start_codon:yes stop_codon:yes gene_type:complete